MKSTPWKLIYGGADILPNIWLSIAVGRSPLGFVSLASWVNLLGCTFENKIMLREIGQLKYLHMQLIGSTFYSFAENGTENWHQRKIRNSLMPFGGAFSGDLCSMESYYI